MECGVNGGALLFWRVNRYNQLGPLLVAVNGQGDVADPDAPGGFSAYPGNINVLSFDLARYVDVLKTSGGVVPEFVNPK